MTNKRTLLQKFLAKSNLAADVAPKAVEEWSRFLNLVNNQFLDFEKRQDLLENTLAASSSEMERLYTELKLAAEKEKENNLHKFEVLFDFSPLPFMFFDENGILDCNKATIDILGGKNKTDIISRHPSVFSPEHQPDGRNSQEKSIEMDRLAREKGFHRFEWTQRSLDGKEFPVEVSISAASFDEKTILMVVWRDLSEIKEKDQMLLHSSKMSSLGEMAGGVAHEINNPLGVILGKADLILKKIESGTYTNEYGIRQISKIIEMSERITKIVKGLKSFSRNAEGDPFLPTELNSIIINVLSLCEEKYKTNAIKVDVIVDKNIVIECRSTQIEQVLLNLLNNSSDAIENTQEKWVRIEALDLGESIQIFVTDSGGGIPPQVVQKLMQPFFTTKGIGQGTGLGLSISKGIIETHHGKFFYDPKSKNTRFVIEIPKSQSNLGQTPKAA
jgi:PAS domain S-box-containing protein